jgi:hypothetical protein
MAKGATGRTTTTEIVNCPDPVLAHPKQFRDCSSCCFLILNGWGFEFASVPLNTSLQMERILQILNVSDRKNYPFHGEPQSLGTPTFEGEEGRKFWRLSKPTIQKIRKG